MSVTNILPVKRYILWGKSAGRCQYRGCNEPIYLDNTTKAEFNQAYIAHIIADVPGGPRGHKTLSGKLQNDLSNLMLLCDVHHRLIDKVDVAGHPASLLRQMKKEHEDRVERVTAIAPNMQSYIVTYRANVGLHSPQVTYEAVRGFLLPKHYPALSHAIELGLSNSPLRDKNASFWETEVENLVTQFNEQLRSKLRKNEIEHISLFAFAPQPLLVKLGTLVSDIHNVEVHQPIREPKTWYWQKKGDNVKYNIIEPDNTLSKVALNISLSANIANERITSVLGDNCSIIYQVPAGSVEKPRLFTPLNFSWPFFNKPVPSSTVPINCLSPYQHNILVQVHLLKKY